VTDFDKFFRENLNLFPKPRKSRHIKHPIETGCFYAGKCFHISKFFQFYFGQNNTRLMMIPDILNSLGQRSTHWFILLNGKVFDFTKSQFNYDLDYSLAKNKEFGRPYFIKNHGKFKSKKYKKVVPTINTINFFKKALDSKIEDRYDQMAYWVNEYNDFLKENNLNDS